MPVFAPLHAVGLNRCVWCRLVRVGEPGAPGVTKRSPKSHCRALATLWKRPRTWEPAQARDVPVCKYTHTRARTHMHTHTPTVDISRRALGKETARKSARGHNKVSQLAATTVLEEEQAAVATAGAQSSGARRRKSYLSARPLPPVASPPIDHRRQ